ncbi:MAG: TonB-dependent receptor, partial [Desulfobacterales bacterium]|nr:TonB-dependent receptor [Desulfobacterales bacterium]
MDDKYLLLVNGRIMNQHTDFGVCTERDMPMLRDIHHIDVVRGPGSALYGPGALAMVINIVTENGSTFEGEEIIARAGAGQKFGSIEYKRGRKLNKDSSFYVYTAVGKVNGSDIKESPIVLGREQTYKGVTYSSDHEHTMHFQNFLQGYQDRPKWKLHGQYQNGGLDIWGRFTQGGEQIDAPNGADRHWYVGQGYDQFTLYGGYTQTISDQTNIQYVLSYDQTTAVSQGMERWRFREEEIYGRIVGSWKPKEEHSFALGTEISHEWFGQRAGSRTAHHWRMGDMPKWETDLLSLFGEYQWKLANPLTLFLSARWDDHSYTDAMFSPRGVLVYTPTVQDAIKLMASRSARTNSAVEMRLHHENNNADSDAETLNAYEIRYERQWTKAFSVAGSVFYHDHEVLG